MIIRTSHRLTYTVLTNVTVNDKRLSWEALGMLTFLLSKPDGWKINREHLIREREAGKDKVSRILRELEAAGYLLRRQFRDETGAFDWENIIREEADSPLPENPPVEAPPPSNQPLVNTDVVKTEVAKNVRERSLFDQSEKYIQATKCEKAFQDFYGLYPRKTHKHSAHEAWKKIEPDLYPKIMARLQTFIRVDWSQRAPDYIPHPASWLRGKQWEDAVIQPSPPKSNGNGGRAGNPEDPYPGWDAEEFERKHVINSPLYQGKR